MDEKNTKIIYIVGNAKVDIPYYLLQLGERAGKSILVIDNAKRKTLSDLFAKEEKDTKEFIEYKSLTIGRNVRYFEEVRGLYDYVFVIKGESAVYDKWAEHADLQIVITNYEKSERQKIKELIKENIDTDKAFVLFRDKITSKVSENDILKEFKMRKAEFNALVFNDSDYALYIALLENKKGNVGAVSGEMKEVLQDLSMRIYGMTDKDFKKFAN